MARRKGHSFEREVAILLRNAFPKARRHLEYQAIEANGVDITGTGFYRFQCKRLKKYASITAINEIDYSEFMGEVPVLVTKGDKTPIMAVLPFDELLRLIELTTKK
jgi:hypothetical protein